MYVPALCTGAVARNANGGLVLTSRGNRLRPIIIRVCDRVALLEVRRQRKLGQMIPVFCLCKQLPLVHAVVGGLLAAQ